MERIYSVVNVQRLLHLFTKGSAVKPWPSPNSSVTLWRTQGFPSSWFQHLLAWICSSLIPAYLGGLRRFLTGTLLGCELYTTVNGIMENTCVWPTVSCQHGCCLKAPLFSQAAAATFPAAREPLCLSSTSSHLPAEVCWWPFLKKWIRQTRAHLYSKLALKWAYCKWNS